MEMCCNHHCMHIYSHTPKHTGIAKVEVEVLGYQDKIGSHCPVCAGVGSLYGTHAVPCCAKILQEPEQYERYKVEI